MLSASIDLFPKQQEIAKGQQEMAATAQAGDYDKAIPMVKDLTTKVEAYLAAAARLRP